MVVRFCFDEGSSLKTEMDGVSVRQIEKSIANDAAFTIRLENSGAFVVVNASHVVYVECKGTSR